MQQRVAVALAWLGKEADLRQCFVDRRGLDVLLDMLTDQRREMPVHKEAASKLGTTAPFIIAQDPANTQPQLCRSYILCLPSDAHCDLYHQLMLALHSYGLVVHPYLAGMSSDICKRHMPHDMYS